MKYEISSVLRVLGQINIEFIFPIKFSNKDILLIFSENLISEFFGTSILTLSNSPFIIILINSVFLLSIVIHILFQVSYLNIFDISIGSYSVSSKMTKILFSLKSLLY